MAGNRGGKGRNIDAELRKFRGKINDYSDYDGYYDDDDFYGDEKFTYRGGGKYGGWSRYDED